LAVEPIRRLRECPLARHLFGVAAQVTPRLSVSLSGIGPGAVSAALERWPMLAPQQLLRRGREVDYSQETRAVRLRVCVALLVAVAAVGSFAVVTSSAAASSGTLTVTTDLKLTEDHVGNIVISSDDVTLDCAGYTVRGPGSGPPEIGVLVDGTSGVTVKNCRVTAFENGIIVANYGGPSSGNTLTANTGFKNIFSGLALLGSSFNTVVGNRTVDNTFSGIVLESAADNRLSNNTAERNGSFGFSLIDSSGNSLQRNVANVNSLSGGGAGFLVADGSNGNELIGNVANQNGRAGIGVVIQASAGNSIQSNTAHGNGAFGILVNDASGNLLEGNSANANGFFGFALNQAVSNTLRENQVKNNVDSGIHVFFSSSNTLARNDASNNGGDGIDVLESNNNVLDSNWASHNDRSGFTLNTGATQNSFTANTAEFNGFGFLAHAGSMSNLVSGNVACKNFVIDAYSEPGATNTWLNNTFCNTSGLP